MRRLVFAVIGLGLVAVVVIGLTQTSGTTAPAAPSAAEVRRALAGSPPALASLHAQAARLLDGGVGAYRARLRGVRGHPVVVNFWASWCGPCRREFPIFQRTAVDLGRRVAFLGVDALDERVDGLAWLRDHRLPYPSYGDPRGAIAHTADVRNLPSTALYDAHGDLAYLRQGEYGSAAQLRGDIARYLGVRQAAGDS